MDVEQLKAADYTEAELQRMIDTSAADAGTEGAAVKQDLDSYVAGINKYIAEARSSPTMLPAEYAAIGRCRATGGPTDTAAVASLIGGIFGRGGGAETKVAAALQAARKRFGPKRGSRVFADFRALNDPEAPVDERQPLPLPRPGARGQGHRGVGIPDAGSVHELRPGDGQLRRRGRREARPRPVGCAACARSGLGLDGPASNATLVRGADSTSGRPLGVTGPQVAYYSPEILLELDLHGGGYDTRGAAFPGISLYVLIGRGKDYSWSATTATTDNVDEFVEQLCEPGGAPPRATRPTTATRAAACDDRPAASAAHARDRRPPTRSAVARDIGLKLLRTVHGPVTKTATLRGKPVAIASARSTYLHELDSALAFKRLSRNEVTGARSFQRTMARINFLFNWFYSDERDIAYLQSGWFPLRARGTDPSLPTLGTGRYDWRNFNADTYQSARASFRQLPKDLNPRRGYIVSWNNKQAPAGARPTTSSDSTPCTAPSDSRTACGRRSGLAQGRPSEARVDHGRRRHGRPARPGGLPVAAARDRRPRDAAERRLLGILDAWVAAAPTASTETATTPTRTRARLRSWTPGGSRCVRGIYEPVMGKDMVERVRRCFPSTTRPARAGAPTSAAGTDTWRRICALCSASPCAAATRAATAAAGRCAAAAASRKRRRASRRRCRAILVRTLKEAAPKAEARYGAPLEACGCRPPVTRRRRPSAIRSPSPPPGRSPRRRSRGRTAGPSSRRSRSGATGPTEDPVFRRAWSG